MDKPEDYLQKRLAKMGDTYHSSWPRWTYNDYVSVQAVLTELATMRARLEQEHGD